MTKFDLIIIGGGPGGYVAAIKAAQSGLNVACVEKRGALGGTCLNEGCIPSKALLESSEKYSQLSTDYAKHGIKVKDYAVDLKVMMDRKDTILKELNIGIESLFKKNKIKYFKGKASFINKESIKVTNQEKEEIISSSNFIIATGSNIVEIPGIKCDEKIIVSSKGALELDFIPKKMVVVGGGYIGLEMGSVWNRLGSEVTIIEYLDKIVPAMDKDLGKTLQKSLESQGIKFRLSTKVISATKAKDYVEIEVQSNDNAKEKIKADIMLVAIGRKPYITDLGLENLGIKIDNKGMIEVDDCFRTNISNIYAIGDVIRGPMLAHKAEEEAIAAVEVIMGRTAHINYNAIPSVIYTHPEVASVGLTEQEIKEQNIEYNSGKFPFTANSRAKAMGDETGFVKVLARKDNDEILGIHIIGPQAGTMIAEAVTALEYKASSEDISMISHAHPTLSEAVKEACLDVLRKAIHK